MTEIVLNEKEWAMKAIESLSLGDKPYETIVRVAKYYKSLGYAKSELRRMVEDFMIRSNPRLSLVKWDGAITSAICAAEKYPMVCISGIMITSSELDKIAELTSVLQQRVMFTLLCLAKYGNAARANNNNWVNIPQKDIFALANVALTNKRQSLMINDLWQAGMIGYNNMVDNVSLQIKIISDGEEALYITDFRNLGNQYMRHLDPSKYTECMGCGLVIKDTAGRVGRPPKYCLDCAGEAKAAQDADRNYLLRLSMQFLEKSKKLHASTP